MPLRDGDPLDAMVIHGAVTTPGLVLRCKLIGVLQTLQKTKHERIRNDRVIAVPENSHRECELHGVSDLPPELTQLEDALRDFDPAYVRFGIKTGSALVEHKISA